MCSLTACLDSKSETASTIISEINILHAYNLGFGNIAGGVQTSACSWLHHLLAHWSKDFFWLPRFRRNWAKFFNIHVTTYKSRARIWHLGARMRARFLVLGARLGARFLRLRARKLWENLLLQAEIKQSMTRRKGQVIWIMGCFQKASKTSRYACCNKVWH